MVNGDKRKEVINVNFGAMENMAEPYKDMFNLINDLGHIKIAEEIFEPINERFAEQLYSSRKIINDSFQNIRRTSEVIKTLQREHIEQITQMVSIFNNNMITENLSNTLVEFQKSITSTMVDSVYQNFDRISKIDFTDIDLSKEAISENIKTIKDENFEDEFVGELVKEKDLSNVSLRFKQVLRFIYECIIILSALLTTFDIIDEKIYPISQRFLEQKQENVFQNEKAELTWLNNELKKEIPEQLRSSFRIVKKDELVVREGKKVNSRMVGVLKTGYIVQIIEKKRNWTYIIYSNPDEGILIEGWTNTRYLKKITY